MPLTVDEHANRSSIGNNNISFVVNRAVVTNVLNTMRTACNSQATIQIYNADIARDFGTRGIFSINSGFSTVIRGGVVTVDLSAGAAIGDSALAFVIDDGGRRQSGYRWTPDR